jgi:hypothetical protein
VHAFSISGVEENLMLLQFDTHTKVSFSDVPRARLCAREMMDNPFI